MPNAFYNIDPKDGFHVVRVDTHDRAELFFQLYAQGKMYQEEDREAVSLFRAKTDRPESMGSLLRMHLVLQAVARFLTTGGDWEVLDSALNLMARACEGTHVVRNGMVAPQAAFPGYYLLDSYVTTEGSFQHIFVADNTTEAVLWEEPRQNDSGGLYGGFIDCTTLDEIRQQQLEEEDEDAARIQAEIDAEYPDDDPTAQELPAERRLGPAEEVAGNTDA